MLDNIVKIKFDKAAANTLITFTAPILRLNQHFEHSNSLTGLFYFFYFIPPAFKIV